MHNDDVIKVFQVKENSISLSFYVTEVKINKYGNVYFGFFSTIFFKTYAYFTQQQIEALSSDFNLKYYDLQSGQSLSNILGTDYLQTEYLYKDENLAREENWYLNLGIIYLFYKRPNSLDERIKLIYSKYDEMVKNGESDLMPRDEALGHNMLLWYDDGDQSVKKILDSIKKYPIHQYCISDAHELILQKPLSKNYKESYGFVDLSAYMDEKLLYAKNIKELVELMCQGKVYNNSLKKELSNYIFKNMIKSSGFIYTLNYPLINQISWLIDVGDFNNFFEMEKLLKIMSEKSKYFEEVYFYKRGTEENSIDYAIAFNKIMKFLMKDVSLEKAIRMYNIFASFSIRLANDLDSVDYEIDTSKYKDAKYLLTQISKRVAEKIVNFDFENKNPGFNDDLTVMESFNYNGYSLHIVRDFKSLFSYGMELSNCAGSNYTLHNYKDSITYVLKKKDKAEYMGCIKDNMIFQFKGFKNKTPERELFAEIFNFLQSNNFIKTLDDHTISKKIKKKSNSIEKIDQLFAQECIQEN